jgi:hypothetical protein
VPERTRQHDFERLMGSRLGKILLVMFMLTLAIVLGWRYLATEQIDSQASSNLPVAGAETGNSSSGAETAVDASAIAPAPSDDDSNDRPNIATYTIESSDPALPPPGTALTQTYAELKRRALAGDNRASCRLATDLVHCSRINDFRSVVQRMTREASNPERDSVAETRAIARAAEEAQNLERVEAMCRGFTPESPHAAWDYLLLAAERGDVRAMVALAVAPPLDENYFLRDQAQWQRYLQLAGPFLRRGVEAGEPFALHMLWWVLAGHPLTGGYAGVPPDPYQARVHAHAILMVGDNHTQATIRRWLLRTQDQVTPAQDAEAQVQGQALARERFAKARPERLSNIPERLVDCSL